MKRMHMRVWFLGLLIFIVPDANCFADTYTGTILETITSTTNPLLFVGETALGTYQYDSQTVDGDFGPR